MSFLSNFDEVVSIGRTVFVFDRSHEDAKPAVVHAQAVPVTSPTETIYVPE